MARHSGGRGWYGKVVGAALGVTVLAVGASVWTAQAGAVGGSSPHAASATPGSDVKPAAVTIVHASDKGVQGVNITIDDGPDPAWTPQVLDVLREYGVKATFCMVGTQAQAHPDLVKKVVAAGHRLCDHSVSHDTAMDAKSHAYQSQQILDAERMITEASGGVRPMYYRAPGGAFTPTAASWPPPVACARWAGTWTPRTSSGRARTPSSPRSSGSCPTGRRAPLPRRGRRPLPDRRGPTPDPALAQGAGLLLRLPGALNPVLGRSRARCRPSSGLRRPAAGTGPAPGLLASRVREGSSTSGTGPARWST